MLQQKLIDLTDFILKYNPYLNKGFAQVMMDDITGVINDGQKRIFPSDSFGNYFYLRIPNQVQADYNKPIADNNLSIGLASDVILVAYMKQGDADILAGNLCTTIGRFQDANTRFSKIIFQNDVVITQELSKIKKEDIAAAMQKIGKATLISIHFRFMVDFVFQNLNCIQNPCKTC